MEQGIWISNKLPRYDNNYLIMIAKMVDSNIILHVTLIKIFLHPAAVGPEKIKVKLISTGKMRTKYELGLN